jgi:ubiquitin-activating enzyme E1
VLAPFWSGPKRAPTPLKFNIDDPLHLEFIRSGANLKAVNYGLHGETDPKYFKEALANVVVPEFSPKKVKIQVNENEAQNDKQVAPSYSLFFCCIV